MKYYGIRGTITFAREYEREREKVCIERLENFLLYVLDKKKEKKI